MNNHRYFHRYLKRRGLNRRSGGMYSITDTAVILHEYLYKKSRTFNKPEAKEFLKQERDRIANNKNRFEDIKSDGCAYFIGNLDYRWVKIGYANSVSTRLEAIQTGCPFELSVLAHIPSKNPRDTEKKLHRRFNKNKEFREWFYMDDDMIEFINIIRDQNDPYKAPLSIE